MIGNDTLPGDEMARRLPYREGSVWSVQLLRSKPGMTAEYLENLRAGWAPVMDEAKKRRVILDYRVMLAPVGGREDWDVMIMVELENMAALDDYGEKMDQLAGQVLPPDFSPVSCSRFRELGCMKLVREVTLT